MKPPVRFMQLRRNVLIVVSSSALLAAVVAFSTVGSGSRADAVQSRSNQLGWRALDGDTAEFHSTVTYQASAIGDVAVGDVLEEVVVDFGDGSIAIVGHTVVRADPAAVVLSEARFTHDYTGPGPFTVTAGYCCRIAGPSHVNNADLPVRVSTTVDLAASSGSPTTTTMGEVAECASEAVCRFDIGAASPDGARLRFRLATPNEAGDASFGQPTGASIDPDSGAYQWDTTGAARNPTGGETYYSTQVIIESLSAEGRVVSHSTVDFLLRLVAPPSSGAGALNAAPVFEAPTPAHDAVIPTTFPHPVSFTVGASDPDAGDHVTIAVGGAPPGATFEPTGTNPVTGTFSWAPTGIGTWVMTLTAVDDAGLAAPERVVRLVVLPSPPNGPPRVNADVNSHVNVTGVVNQPLVLQGAVVDPNPADTVVWAWDGNGAPCTFSDVLALSPTVTCTAVGTFLLTLTASDGVNPEVHDNLEIRIFLNRPALVTAGPDLTGVTGRSVGVNGFVSDPDTQDVVLIEWTASDPGCTFSNRHVASTGVVCTAPGAHVLTLTADDQVNPAVSDTTTFSVVQANRPPVVSAGAARSGFREEPISLEGSASDPDGDPLETTWQVLDAGAGADAAPPVCVVADGSALVTSVTCTAVGSFSLRLSVFDGVNPPVSSTLVVSVDQRVVDPPPVLALVNAGNDVAGSPRQALVLDAEVAAPGQARWTSSSSACRFANRRSVDTTVRCSRVGTFTLTLTLRDGVNPPLTDTVVVTVTRAPGGKPELPRPFELLGTVLAHYRDR